jgi:GNAT superfamily N-acetyltransferase
MSDIHYQNLIFDEDAILNLYLDNGWTMYTKDPKTLFEGIKNSLYSYAAYEKNKLIGLIRVVGDNNTIIYIQDILVLESYQQKGIGTSLIQFVINKHKDVRQICLMTGKSEKQKAFYEKNCFKEYGDLEVVGFLLDK